VGGGSEGGRTGDCRVKVGGGSPGGMSLGDLVLGGAGEKKRKAKKWGHPSEIRYKNNSPKSKGVGSTGGFFGKRMC